MGVIDRLIGGADATRALGQGIGGVAEVFRVNATREMELAAELRRAAMAALAAEFARAPASAFDRAIDGLNRLPRPLLAFGTLGLFVHAMVDPAGFAARMAGLGAVPEPLWWLLGAIVSFYFGARELHYFRRVRPPRVVPPSEGPRRLATGENAAISAWRADGTSSR